MQDNYCDGQDPSSENKPTPKSNPKVLLLLKIIGFVILAVGIVFFVISRLNFGNFENDWFMTGGIIGGICFVIGFLCVVIGFLPQMAKWNIKLGKHIQEQNKEDLTSIANTSAEINEQAIETAAKAAKRGLDDDSETKFCSQCCKKISKNSKFCSHCGAEQE